MIKSLYATIALCSILLLAACGGSQSAGAGMQHAAYKPSLDVKLEVSGTTVKVKVDTDMAISTEHYGLARKDGEGHIHMYLDDGEKIVVQQGEHVLPDVKPGPHTLRASLHNNDHTPYDVTKTIEFTIQ